MPVILPISAVLKANPSPEASPSLVMLESLETTYMLRLRYLALQIWYAPLVLTMQIVLTMHRTQVPVQRLSTYNKECAS